MSYAKGNSRESPGVEGLTRWQSSEVGQVQSLGFKSQASIERIRSKQAYSEILSQERGGKKKGKKEVTSNKQQNLKLTDLMSVI